MLSPPPLRLMAFDIDGVLTNGQLHYGAEGEVFKSFHAHDGLGLQRLMQAGVTVAMITARRSPINERRASDLGILHLKQGAHQKDVVLRSLANELAVPLEQVGFMGDDLIDLPAMRIAGFAATVSEAPGPVRLQAHWVASRPAGFGAARELSDWLLSHASQPSHSGALRQ